MYNVVQIQVRIRKKTNNDNKSVIGTAVGGGDL